MGESRDSAEAHAETVQHSGDAVAETVQQSGDTVASADAPLAGDDAVDLPEVPDARYVIAGEVGRGGIGRVMSARDEVLDRPVAVKQLLATDDAARRRFIREALITARLQHPAIIPVYDAGRRQDRSPFYAMKLVAGRPLDRAIAAAKTLRERLALLPTLLAVADAIAYAHSQRIIHRDLKPGNVLVGEFGETIVIDWGLAKDLSIDDRDARDAGPYRVTSSDQTVAGSVLGTPGYMAPEQAAGQEVDERADVYALGAMLYHVVSGSIPHEGSSMEEVLESAIDGSVKPLATRVPETPPDLAAIVDKAMAVESARRYPTARELAEDLRRFQTGQLVGAHRYTLGDRVRRWIKRNRTITAVVAIATLVLVGFGAWSLQRIVAERDRADRERDEAITNANRAILTQARVSLEHDPAATLAWLARLAPDGEGWSAARTIAADALSQPLPEVLLHGSNFARATPDGRYAIGLGTGGVWISELVAGAKPTIVQVDFGPADETQIEACDDGRRGLVLTDENDPNAKILTFDLKARREIGSLPYDERAWLVMRGDCRADARLHRAGRMGPGLRWGEPSRDKSIMLTFDAVRGAWLAADKRHVVVLDAYGSVRRFDVTTGAEVTTLKEAVAPKDTSAPPRAAMSNDGMVFAVINDDEITFCDLDMGTCMPLSERATDKDTIAAAPDGAWVRVTTGERTWHYKREMPIPSTIDSPRGALQSSLDGKWLLALDEDGTLRVQDIAAGTTRVVHGHDKIRHVQALPDGRVFTVGSEGSVRVTSLGKPATTHKSFQQTHASFSAQTKWVVVDPSDRTLLRVELATGRADRIAFPDKKVLPHAVINDAGEVGYVARDGTVHRFDAGAWKQVASHTDARLVDALMLADGSIVTLTRQSLAVSSKLGTRTIAIPGGIPENSYSALQVSRDEHRLLVPCGAHHCLIDPRRPAVVEIKELTGRTMMAEDGSVALGGAANGDHVVWDLDKQRERKRFRAADPTYGVVGIARDGARAVVRSATGVEIVDLATLARTPLRSRQPLAIGWAVFSPDGKSVLDNTTMLWDVASGEGRRLAPRATGISLDLLNDRAAMVTLGSVDLIPDDLPREPAALAAKLRALPYQLDDTDTLHVPGR